VYYWFVYFSRYELACLLLYQFAGLLLNMFVINFNFCVCVCTCINWSVSNYVFFFHVRMFVSESICIACINKCFLFFLIVLLYYDNGEKISEKWNFLKKQDTFEGGGGNHPDY